VSDESTEQPVAEQPAAEEPVAVEAPAGRTPMTCPRCGATVESDQAWCLECGLAVRTRVAPVPNWRAPLVAAGVIGLGAIVALVIAFLTITGDNAPLPTTATAPVTVVDTTATTTVPGVTPGTTVPGATTTATTTATVPATTTATVPATTTATVPAIPTTSTATTP
jgi:hypothetical protein